MNFDSILFEQPRLLREDFRIRPVKGVIVQGEVELERKGKQSIRTEKHSWAIVLVPEGGLSET
jgi:hypothetical protein